MKTTSITLLALCEVAAMSLWFSASAVVPSITAEYPLSDLQISLFTSSVQAGFVLGTLASAVLGLADRLEPRRFFMVSALIASAANASILLIEPGSSVVFVARLVTGICMAGIYPIGMKMAGSWARGDLGLLVAILVGALTLGSAAPHLFNAFGGIDWRFTIMTTSAAGLFAALAINLVKIGPRQSVARAFSASQLALAFRDPALRLANFGYLGHMWELYAMWAWIGIFLAASFSIDSGGYDPDLLARYAAFAVIGAGGLIGCLAGGLLSDRYGRTTLTMAAMAISGCCALTAGFLFGGPPLLLGIVCMIWGVTIIADSAQFSASITELSEPELIGTMLTVQTCAGFILTLITIHLMPLLVEIVGWGWAFAPLAIGPFFGVWAMYRLRQSPQSVRLAGGRR